MSTQEIIEIKGRIDVVEADCGDYIALSRWDDKGASLILVEELIGNRKLNNMIVTIRYWISPEEITKDQAIEANLRQLMGDVEGKWHSIYSEATGYLVLDENLVIGGHDLKEEFHSHIGKYLIMEIEVHGKSEPKPRTNPYHSIFNPVDQKPIRGTSINADDFWVDSRSIPKIVTVHYDPLPSQTVSGYFIPGDQFTPDGVAIARHHSNCKDQLTKCCGMENKEG